MPAGSPTAVFELAPATAEMETIQSILEDTGVNQNPPGPSVGAYLEEVGIRFLESVTGYLSPNRDLFATLFELGKWFAVLLLIAVAGWALIFLARRLVAARVTVLPDDSRSIRIQGSGRSDHPADSSAWRSRFHDALEKDRLDDALNALWWWVARSLAGDAADESWTSRDLGRRASSPEIAELLRRFDVLVYGPVEATIDDVVSLVDNLLPIIEPEPDSR